MKKILILSAATLVLSSCGIYNKYKPVSEVPEGLYGSETVASADTANFGNLSWREVFTDSYLQNLSGCSLNNRWSMMAIFTPLPVIPFACSPATFFGIFDASRSSCGSKPLAFSTFGPYHTVCPLFNPVLVKPRFPQKQIFAIPQIQRRQIRLVQRFGVLQFRYVLYNLVLPSMPCILTVYIR